MKKLKTQKKIKSKQVMRELDLSGDDPLDQDFTNVYTSGQWVNFSDLFEFQPKNKTITFRLSESMLDHLKTIANKENTDYQKLIREAVSDLITKKMSNVI